jgi:hypothetical protein
MRLEDLRLMSIEQLRAVHDNLGIPYHHKAKEDKLIQSILSVQTPVVDVPRAGAAPKLGEGVHTAVQELKPIKRVVSVEYPSVDDVMEAIEAYVQRGVEVVHLDDDGFHFRRGGREDSGTLKQPLRRIVECAGRLLG